MTLRKLFAHVLEGSGSHIKVGRLLDGFLIVLITINVIAIVLESVAEIALAHKQLFVIIELVSVAIFTVEYLLRIWACVDKEEYRDLALPHWKIRLKYIRSPLAVIDLLAILPTYLTLFVNLDLRFLRVFRLMRVFKLTRYSKAMQLLLQSFKEERHSLLAAFFIMAVALIIASCGIYLLEHDVQPDKFGSIPESMWWALVTLTTVGYGDVVPITPLGKLFGAMITVLSMGMVAIPTGLLASSFSEQLRRRRKMFGHEVAQCLQDGQLCEDDKQRIEKMRIDLGLSVKEAEQAVHNHLEHHKHIRFCKKCGHKVN